MIVRFPTDLERWGSAFAHDAALHTFVDISNYSLRSFQRDPAAIIHAAHTTEPLAHQRMFRLHETPVRNGPPQGSETLSNLKHPPALRPG